MNSEVEKSNKENVISHKDKQAKVNRKKSSGKIYERNVQSNKDISKVKDQGTTHTKESLPN